MIPKVLSSISPIRFSKIFQHRNFPFRTCWVGYTCRMMRHWHFQGGSVRWMGAKTSCVFGVCKVHGRSLCQFIGSQFSLRLHFFVPTYFWHFWDFSLSTLSPLWFLVSCRSSRLLFCDTLLCCLSMFFWFRRASLRMESRFFSPLNLFHFSSPDSLPNFFKGGIVFFTTQNNLALPCGTDPLRVNFLNCVWFRGDQVSQRVAYFNWFSRLTYAFVSWERL